MEPLLEEGSTSSSTTDEDFTYEKDDFSNPSKRQSWWARRSRFWKTVIFCLAVASVDFLIRGSMLLHQHLKNSSTTTEIFTTKVGDCYCGHSVAEAKSLGCTYDALAIYWAPPECRDDELTAEFNRAGPGPNGEWPYFADDMATIPLTDEEVSLLADTDMGFYTIHEWHLVHCNYSWRKLFRAQQTGVVMDREKNSLEHIAHCGMLEGPKYHNLTLNSLATGVTNSLKKGGGDIEARRVKPRL